MSCNISEENEDPLSTSSIILLEAVGSVNAERESSPRVTEERGGHVTLSWSRVIFCTYF